MERQFTSGSRQLVIGLDAMEWSLVQCWAQQGKLPAFRRVMDTGVRAALKSTATALPDTVWPSLYSGQNPGKFGRYCSVQYDPAAGALKHVAENGTLGVPFWDHLSRAGRRAGVVDAPHARPSAELHGFQLANWCAHSPMSPWSQPESLLAQVSGRYGEHPIGHCDAAGNGARSHRALRRRILEGVRLQGELFRWLARERRWDVLFCVFSAPHCAGHHFWKYRDKGHPRFRAGDPDGLADALEDVYKAVDREIGGLIETAGTSTAVMLVAAHGMGPVSSASSSLDEILNLLGFGRPGGRPAKVRNRTAHVNPWRVLNMTLPARLQYAIRKALPQRLQDQLLFRWYSGRRDWRGHQAFALPNVDSVGAIRVAVKGRDRYGCIAPGEEYRHLCREIAAAIQELTDPVSGRPVVKQVTFASEEFSGPFTDSLPDIMVLWDQSFSWSAVRSPRFGDLAIPPQDARSGTHTPHGFMLAAGPGIPANVEITGASIYDIAPTVLAAAGVPIPAEMDGAALGMKRRAMA